MKKHLLAILILAFVAISCRREHSSTSIVDVQNPPQDLRSLNISTFQFDTTIYGNEPEFQDFGYPSFSISVDFPDPEQAPLLANAYAEWIMECLSFDYNDNLLDINHMIRSFFARTYKSETNEGGPFFSQTQCTIKKTFENSQLVTFVCDGSTYFIGAAHGTPYSFGATFRKGDGKIFGSNLFRTPFDNDLLIQGLKKYFNCSSDNQLLQCLVGDYDSTFEIPMPSNQPWVEADGIHYVYQPYEIAAYSDGFPTVVIPFSQAAPALTPLANNLINAK